GGREAEMNEGVVAPSLLRRQVLRHVELLDLRGDARRKRRAVEACDRRDTRAGVADRIPRGGKTHADRRNNPHSGDDDAAARHWSAPIPPEAACSCAVLGGPATLIDAPLAWTARR